MAAAAQEKYRKRQDEEEKQRARESKPQTRSGQRLTPSTTSDRGGAQRSDRPRGMAANRNPRELPPNNPIRGNPPPARPGGQTFGTMPMRPATGPAPSTGAAIQAALMRNSPTFAGSQGVAPAPRAPIPAAAPRMAPVRPVRPMQAMAPAMQAPLPPSPAIPLQQNMAAAPPAMEEPRTGMPVSAMRGRAPTMAPGPGAGPVASPVMDPRIVGGGNPMGAPVRPTVPFGTAMGAPNANPTPVANRPTPGGEGIDPGVLRAIIQNMVSENQRFQGPPVMPQAPPTGSRVDPGNLYGRSLQAGM